MTATSDATAAGAQDLVIEQLDALLEAHPPDSTPMEAFLGAQFDMGLAWVHFPVGLGGLELPTSLQAVIDDRLSAAGAPSGRPVNTTAYGQGAATILAYGSSEQKQRYLRPIFTCEEIWCQLFSEPGSGSDLASLATRAERDGDEWVVNGQKVWTTRGHLARFGLLLARTDPDLVKHAGLTYFVLDMHQPGVEVKPLRQITGEAGFNEVFITDARIPDTERLGEVGEGWKVSTTTLAQERYNFMAPPSRGSGPIATSVRLWSERADKTSAAAMAMRDRLVRLWIDAEVGRLTMMRATEARRLGNAGPESSIGKLGGAERGKAIAALNVDLLGAGGMLYDSYEMRISDGGRTPERGAFAVQRGFVGSPSGSIAGGTSDIQRNIIGERVLGLPREPAPDKGLPWSRTLRN
jgi:alkylation response protein AidB-like acyl-CoA dehydrogenase